MKKDKTRKQPTRSKFAPGAEAESPARQRMRRQQAIAGGAIALAIVAAIVAGALFPFFLPH